MDLAVRGRATSSAPQDLVEAAAAKAGVTISGESDARDNRLAGLGPLTGTAVGVLVGAWPVYVIGRGARGHAIPTPIAVLSISAAAMALSDVPLKVFGVSDPADWKWQDWTADATPHLMFCH